MAVCLHPDRLQLDEFQREMSSAYGTNSDDIISQARSWEQGAEYRRAVETYLKLTVQNCGDHTLLVKVWLKVSQHSTPVSSSGVLIGGVELAAPPPQAVDLSCKFIEDRATDVVALVCDRLANIGEYEQVSTVGVWLVLPHPSPPLPTPPHPCRPASCTCVWTW